MPDGCWPSPVGVGGGTTPPFGHPSLKEGNVSGSLTSAGRRCILLRQPSPVRRLSPPRPQAAPTRGPNHHVLSESNAPSLPQTVSSQEPEHHGEPERNAPSPPQTAPVPRHSPPLRRGGRRPGWSARAAAGRAPPPNPLSPSPLQQKCTFAHIYGIIYAKKMYFCGFFVNCAKCGEKLVVSS